MYRVKPNLSIGFHGCSEDVRGQLLNFPNKIKFTKNNYDWLCHGFYVWKNNLTRAIQWAKDKAKNESDFRPSVIGVIYQLDNCLDFLDSE